MQLCRSVALLLMLAITVSAGNGPLPAVGGDDGQVVAACDAPRALVARSACRASLDCPPVGLVADGSVGGGPRFAGRVFECVTTEVSYAGATSLGTRPRGPPAPRA